MTPLNRRLRPPCSLICCVDVVRRGTISSSSVQLFREADAGITDVECLLRRTQRVSTQQRIVRLYMTQHRHAGCAACLDSYWSKKTSGRNLWRPCHAQHRHPSAPVYCINPGIHCSWLSHHGNSRQGLQSNWLRNKMTTTALCSNPFIPLLCWILSFPVHVKLSYRISQSHRCDSEMFNLLTSSQLSLPHVTRK